MKKIIAIFFCLALGSATCFADFIVSPTLGFSHIFLIGGNSRDQDVRLDGEGSWVPFTFGFDMGYVGKSGFTFMFNNHFSTGGNIDLTVHTDAYYLGATDTKKIKIKKIGGIFWSSNLLFGYAYQKIPNLSISFALGFAGGMGTLKNDEEFSGHGAVTFHAGVPLHIGVDYYFTRNIGIHVGLVEVLSWAYCGKGSLYIEGFESLFTLKVGPIFRL